MTELLIIRTENSQEIRKFSERKHIDYEIYQFPFSRNLKECIEKKRRENIFTDYGEALKDKELEAEKVSIEEDYEEEDQGDWWEWKKSYESK